MKKSILCILSAAVILSIGILPGRIVGGVARFSIITPQQEEYRPELGCNGYVLAKEGIKLVVNGNVVVKELSVASGSWVTAGQVIAITDSPDIGETFLSQSLDSPDAQLDSGALEALAAQYGVEVPGAGSKGAAAIREQLDSAAPTPKVAKAPISGILTWNDVEDGRFIPAGSLFCTILGLDNYKAVVQVPAEEASSIAIGAPAVITGSEIDQAEYHGSVLTVGNSVTRGVTAGGYSSVIQVEIAVDAPIDSMRHGAGVSCTIATGEARPMLTLPYEAIHQDDSNHEYVYLAVNNVLKKQYIKTGIELADTIEVSAGISPGDVVAEVPNDKLPARYLLEPEKKKG